MSTGLALAFSLIINAGLIFLLYLIYNKCSYLTSVLDRLHKLRNNEINNTKRWVKEYWTLRNSDACITDDYDINLSWESYDDNNIRPKAEKL